MSENVDSALKIFLARKPSDKARAELATRPPDILVYGILLGDEFHEKILTPIRDEGAFLHDSKKVLLTADDLEWVRAYLPLSPFSRDRLATAESWRDLYEVVLRDAMVRDNLKRLYASHVRLPRFIETADQAGEVLRGMRKSDGVVARVAGGGGAIRPSGKMPIVTRGAQVVKLAEAAAAKAPPAAPAPVAEKPATKNAPAKPAEPAGEKVLFADAAEEMSAARGMLEQLRSGSSFSALRTDLFKFFGKAQGFGLVWIERQITAKPLSDPHLQYFVLFTVARVYLRHFMNETCYQLSARLVAQKDELRKLSDFDRSRLYRTHFLASVRSGRADEAIVFYRDAMLRYPAEWEYYYQVADMVAFQNPDEASDLYEYALRLGPTMNPANRISIADFYAQQGRMKDAMLVLLGVLKDTNVNIDAYLALGNMAVLKGDRAAWTTHLGTYFEKQGLSAADFEVTDKKGLFGFGQVEAKKRDDHPLVTIVMTSFNAEATLSAVIRSIQNQTCANLELIIVDDCSQDASRDIIKKAAAGDKRIRHIFNDVNMGTYCSKNKGVLMAKGDFITFHDSDDWMHPQRVEVHLAAMQEGVQGTISNWVRMREDGFCVTRKGGGYIHRNPASTFIRREVFDEIGVFDSVRTGADTELLWRVKNHYGQTSFKELEQTLALGLHRDDSLTTAGVAAFDEYRFSPVRLRYAESWVRDHIDGMIAGRMEFMPYPHRDRRFEAPKEIAVTEFDS